MRSESLVEMRVGAAGIPAITSPSLLISVAGRAERVKAMGRAFICLGALTAALLAAAPEARAKMVYYEINGQRYSYSTNNRAQVKEARQRIDAANAAEAAKAQAERSANPLVAVFGSKVQSDAKEAEARAQQALSAQAKAEPAAGRAPEAPTRRRGGTEAAQAKAQPAKTARTRAARHAAPAVKVASRGSRKPAAEVPAKPAVASVFYDAESGIKTMQMTDGTVREEPFDPSSTPEGRAGPDATGALQKPAKSQ